MEMMQVLILIYIKVNFINYLFALQGKVEMMWAIKAYEHAEIYFNVSTLKLYFYIQCYHFDCGMVLPEWVPYAEYFYKLRRMNEVQL